MPALFWLPPALVGVFLIAKQGQYLGSGLWFLIASTVIGWFAVNQFGFFENEKMRKHLERILKAQEKPIVGEFIFVGFATPKYSSMVDAHEDVGFFRIMDDRIQFISETRSMDILKSDIREIGYRANVHSILGLGGWVSVDATVGDRRFRLLIEPRERNSMLASKKYRVRLVKRLNGWLKGEA